MRCVIYLLVHVHLVFAFTDRRVVESASLRRSEHSEVDHEGRVNDTLRLITRVSTRKNGSSVGMIPLNSELGPIQSSDFESLAFDRRHPLRTEEEDDLSSRIRESKNSRIESKKIKNLRFPDLTFRN